MRPGEDPSQPIVATGLFFKDLSYRWQDGLGIAPVVLAKDVVVSASTADEPNRDRVSRGQCRVARPESAKNVVRFNHALRRVSGHATRR